MALVPVKEVQQQWGEQAGAGQQQMSPEQLEALSQDPSAYRGYMMSQAMSEYLKNKLSDVDSALSQTLKKLETDSTLADAFADIRANGANAADKYYSDERLMASVSEKMGGIPQDMMPAVLKIENQAVSIHEGAMKGDLKAVEEFVAKNRGFVDEKDSKGVSPLGYAIGANRLACVKALLNSHANVDMVDTAGNSGLHYAAGYGRKAMVELLLKEGASPSRANAAGQTPMDAAKMNKHNAIADMLRPSGAE